VRRETLLQSEERGRWFSIYLRGMFHARILFALLWMAFVFCVPSHADIFGHYCSSEGYIAYEVVGDHPNDYKPNGDYRKGHLLRIVRFEAKRGIYIAGEVSLQNFTVHRMICGQDRVEIAGWERIFEKYVIGIAGLQGIRILDHTKDPSRKFDPAKDSPDPPDFSPWGQSGEQTLQLESDDSDHRYQLHIRRWDAKVKNGFEHYSKAELIQIDAHGDPKQHLLLYEDHYLESGE